MEQLLERIRRIGPNTVDWLYAIGLTGAAWIVLALSPLLTGQHMPLPQPAQNLIGSPIQAMPITYLLVALVFLPLAFRRRFPVSTLVTSMFFVVVYELGHFPSSFLVIAPLFAVYSLGTMRSRGVLLIGTVLSAVLIAVVSSPGFADNRFWLTHLSTFAMFGAVAAAGQAVRNQRAYVAEVEARAAEAERTREEETHRRVDEERLRIARELHDVTAHSLSIIAVQSGAASHVLDSNPIEARRSLEAIRQTSKGALDELRAMLRVLRSADEPGAPLAPVPGLGRINELTAPLMEAGFTIHRNFTGDLADVPSVVDFSAYRIIQEALTNVVRHAGICTVWLTLRRDARGLTIEIADDGKTPASDARIEGHGLAGMRERATALGGAFEAGLRAEGGFRVVAYLPLDGEDSRE
ncbi:MAG: sensor histidine kinase [Coriobacteriia bacterium]|nr:sensor histidine kinase [Coriobacteriia bacterium]